MKDEAFWREHESEWCAIAQQSDNDVIAVQFWDYFCGGPGEMTFGDALEAMKCGHRASRPGWIRNKVWIELTTGPCSLPFILSVYNGVRSPWSAPHDDLLADDWFVPEFMTAHTDDAGRF